MRISKKIIMARRKYSKAIRMINELPQKVLERSAIFHFSISIVVSFATSSLLDRSRPSIMMLRNRWVHVMRFFSFECLLATRTTFRWNIPNSTENGTNEIMLQRSTQNNLPHQHLSAIKTIEKWIEYTFFNHTQLLNPHTLESFHGIRIFVVVFALAQLSFLFLICFWDAKKNSTKFSQIKR